MVDTAQAEEVFTIFGDRAQHRFVRGPECILSEVRVPPPRSAAMNIDLLITELEPGGAERCCAALARYLHERNHRVRVLSLGARPTPPKDLLVRQLEAEGIRTLFLDARNGWSLPWAWNRLRRTVRSDPPDVAQCFLWHANVLGAAAYPSLGIPVVAGVRVVEPRRWRARMAPLWAPRMACVVCVSQEVAAWCQQMEGIDSERLVVIPNGVAPVSLPRHDPRTDPSHRILLSVGRLDPQKGSDGLMRCTDTLLERLPEHRLVLIGDGPLRGEWQQRRAASKHGARIDLLGQREDVLDWMAHAELLLHPARYEGMPNVVLEAMACGLAVVAMRVEGIAALLGDRETEQAVPKDDWSAWLQRVVDLCQHPTLRQDLGIANRERALHAFRLEDQMAKYEALLDSLALSRSKFPAD